MSLLLLSPGSAIALTNAVHTMVLGALNFWFSAMAPPSAQRSAGIARAGMDLWKLRRAYTEATESGSLDAVLSEAKQLAPSPQDVATAFKVWTEVVEELMHEVEVRHGPAASGVFKKLEVEAALLNWYRTSGLVLPLVPEVAQPLVIRIAADWTVEMVYALVTQVDLWRETDVVAPAPTQDGPLARVWLSIVNWATSTRGLLALATRGAWWLVQKDLPLAPHMRSLTEAAGAQTQAAVNAVGVDMRQLVTWLNQHQKDVASVTRLVSVAVHEAEGFLEMSGPQKKEYATDLLLAFLIDEGLISASGGLGYAVANWLINWLIDSTVQIFNKRDHFTHHSQTLPPSATNGAAALAANTAAAPAQVPVPSVGAAGRPVAVGTGTAGWLVPGAGGVGGWPVPGVETAGWPFPAGAGAASPWAGTNPLLRAHAAANRAAWEVFKRHLTDVVEGLYPPPSTPR